MCAADQAEEEINEALHNVEGCQRDHFTRPNMSAARATWSAFQNPELLKSSTDQSISGHQQLETKLNAESPYGCGVAPGSPAVSKHQLFALSSGQ